MANGLLELLLQLRVEGTQDASELEAAIALIKDKLKELEGIRTLDKMFNPGQVAGLDLIVQKTKQMVDLLTIAGKTPLDLNVTEANRHLDLLVDKARIVFDLVTSKGKTQVDFDVSQANRKLDLIVQKSKAMVDELLIAGKTKLDLDLTPTTQELFRATAQTAKWREQMRALKGEATGIRGGQFTPFIAEARLAQGATASLGREVTTLTRDLLLIRRAAFGLGFSFVAKEIINVAVGFDRMHQSLSAVFGDAEKANVEFEFLKQTAERLGLDITSLTDRYAKLTIAGRSVGLSQEIVKENFLAVSEAGARLHLSVEQIDGALLALEQIASKGKVSMEELRRQLGNSLPGAMSIAAKALDVTVPKLFELVENGQLASDVFLTVFPRAIRAAFSVDASTRIETTQAAITRFTNAIKFFTDAIVRAGILDSFVATITSLAKATTDPNVVKFFKDMSASIGDLTTFLRENINAIELMIKAYLGIKALGILTGVIGSLAASFRTLAAATAAANGVAAAGAASAASIAAVGTAATGAATKVGTLGARLSGLLAVALHPITLVVSIVGAAGVEVLFNQLNKVNEALFINTQRAQELTSANNLTVFFREQADALAAFADTAILSAAEIGTLARDTIPLYKEEVELARAAAEANSKSLEQQVKASTLILEGLKAKGKLTAVEVQQTKDLTERIKVNTEEQLKAVALVAKYDTVLKDLASVTAGSALKLEDLSAVAKGQVKVFNDAIESGKGLRQSLEKAIPDSFADGGVKAIRDVANQMQVLANTTSLTGRIIEEELAKKLDHLSGEELQRFAINARVAFDGSANNAERLSLILGGVVKAALKNLGVDVQTEGDHVTKKFAEMARSLVVVADEARDTGNQLKESILTLLSTAKTRDELLLLAATLEQVGARGGRFAEPIKDALQRLDDRLLETKGVLDNSLGDSFKRLGIATAESLNSIALLAELDFGRVAVSGIAAPEGIRQAWIKTQEAISKASGLSTESIALETRLLTDLSKPLDSLLAVADHFGVKTRFELEQTAIKSQEAFKIMKESGEFTFADLDKAAKKMTDDVIAAFGNMADTIEQGPVKRTFTFTGLARTFTFKIAVFDPSALKSASDEDWHYELTVEIPKFLKEGMPKASGDLATANVTAELQRRSREAWDNANAAANQTALARNRATNTTGVALAPSTTGPTANAGPAIPGPINSSISGGAAVNFTIQTLLTAENAEKIVRTVIIPELETQLARKR